MTDVIASSHSLWAFNAGLLSFMLIKILANGYYARQDTKTPVKIGIIAMISNMFFNLLAIPFGYVGLAMASAMSGTLNATLLYKGLKKGKIYRFSGQSFFFLLKVLMSSLVMGLGVFYLNPTLEHWGLMSFSLRLLWLGGLIALATVLYSITLLVLGVRPRHLMR